MKRVEVIILLLSWLCAGCGEQPLAGPKAATPTATHARAKAPPAEPPTMRETVENMAAWIANDVAAGFHTPEEIVKARVELYADEQPPEKLTPIAKRIVARAVAEHAAAQAAWPQVTDCDRLDQAFDELDQHGIVSRQNFSCCDDCAAKEIVEELAKVEKAGRRVRGYVFYHSEDTDNTVAGDPLKLTFGSADGSEATTILIGREVVRTLAEHGFEVQWDGGPQTRMATAIDWKRRR